MGMFGQGAFLYKKWTEQFKLQEIFSMNFPSGQNATVSGFQ